MPRKNYAIATCCTRDWLPFAAVTLLSCRKWVDPSAVDMHVLVLDAELQDVEKFKTFCAKHGFDTSLFVLPETHRVRALAINHLGVSTFMRFFLPEYLSSHYERVLYIDSDVLAERPLMELFYMDMKGKSLAAVEDRGSYPGENGEQELVWGFQKIGFPMGARYFNAGILLMDWQKLLLNGRLNLCVGVAENAKKLDKFLPHADQDILNLVFVDDWQRLHPRFNAFEPIMHYVASPPVLRHFTAAIKPWQETWIFSQRRARSFYREMLGDSPWNLCLKTRFTRGSLRSSIELFKLKFDRKTRNRMIRHLNAEDMPPTGVRSGSNLRLEQEPC